MTSHDQTRLLDAAAHHARAEGWLAHELPEFVLAVARSEAIPCSPDMAQRIAKAASK